MKKGRATTKRAKRPEPYAEQISEGIKWLDVNYPDWLGRIELRSLNLISPCGCIIGQSSMHGFYSSPFGLEEARNEACKMGFARPFTSGLSEWRSLTNAWKRRITKLRKARAK